MAQFDLKGATAIAEGIDAHRVTRLPVLVLNVHTSCNCRCMMCDIWKTSEAKSLAPAHLEPHLSSIRRLGVRWVVFTGGEPLMNRAFGQLSEMLRKEHVRLTLLTTGLLLGKFAEDVARSFDDIIISLDGPEEIHDSIRRVRGGFRLIGAGIQAIRRLRADFRVTARTTVQKANFRQLRETVGAAKTLTFDGISLLAVDLTSEAFNRPLLWPVERQNEVGLSLADVEDLTIEVENLTRENAEEIRSGFIAESPQKLRRIVRHFRAQLGLEAPEAPQCNAPWTSAVVEVDGSVRPCFFHAPIGDLRKQTLEEAVNSEQALQFRSALDVRNNLTCRRCVCSLNYRG
jgi:Fe-coproporphyrin III synthase